MLDSILPRRKVGKSTYKELSLDFCDFSYSYLIEKTDRKFLRRSEAYMLLCRRFSLKKKVVKGLLREMEERGLISSTNRGIYLL